MSAAPRGPPGAAVTMAHGAGGKAMHDLIDRVFAARFDNPLLAVHDDSACVELAALARHGDRLAFTTDSYVVDPLFFPGGDIGRLAVCGTVNDLAVTGARPLFLSCAVIAEEGTPIDVLERVAESMRAAAAEAGVSIITGDTKVVPRGVADKLFVNTAGIGVVPDGVRLGAARIRPGDALLVSGHLGDHAVAIIEAREELALQTGVRSDCAPLTDLMDALLASGVGLRCARDATRGGVAAVANEFAASAAAGIRLDEHRLPVREPVRGACELLGLDALYFANEGVLVAVVARADAERALAALQSRPAGRDAAIVGEVTASPPGVVSVRTAIGGERILDMPIGEQLPRIC